MITVIPNHVAQALARLREQYQSKPNIEALIQSWTNQIQELEEITSDMSTNRTVNSAVGIQLDRLGELLNRPREGRTDEQYRIVLLAKISQNISRGTPEDVINVFKVLTSSAKVYLSDDEHGEIYLLADHVLTQDDVNTIIREMYTVVAAGVRINGLGSFDPDDSFAFYGVDIAKGFSSVLDTSKGGKLATIRKPNDKKFAFAGTIEIQEGFGSLLDPDLGGVFVSL